MSTDESSEEPLGRRGTPLARHSPFYIGFVGALGALVAYGLLTLLGQAAGVLVLVVVSGFLAVGLNPIVELMVRHGVRRGVAVACVALGFLLLVGLFLGALVPVLAEQITAVQDNVPTWIEQLRRNDMLQSLDERYDLFSTIQEKVTSESVASSVFGGVLGVGMFVLNAVFNTVVIFALTLYLLAGLPHIKEAFLRLVPASRRDRVGRLTDAIVDQTGAYVAGAAAVALTAGVCAFIFLTIVGLGDYAIALAVVVALLGLIPMIGATISAIIVSLIGFATGVGIGIACIAYFVVYQQVENYVIYPRIMSRTLSVPGVVTVVAALLGGALLGLVGAILALPVAAGILYLMREVALPRQDSN